jgi:hypothetical protein
MGQASREGLRGQRLEQLVQPGLLRMGKPPEQLTRQPEAADKLKDITGVYSEVCDKGRLSARSGSQIGSDRIRLSSHYLEGTIFAMLRSASRSSSRRI